MTPLAFLQEKAREWFEEVAMVGMQRAPVLGDPWRFGGRLEERMIGALDALASIGPVAPTHVERLCRDAPLKDERVAFATAMCLGMFEGRDALGAAERLLHEHVAEVGFVAGFGAGLALAPHDRIGGAMRQLADGDDDAIAAMAVDVLGFRGLATGDELERWARRGDASLHAALRHALGVRHDGLERMATEARDHGDRTLARQAHLVAIAAGVRFASAKLDERARGEDGEAFATLLAVAGDESQATWILERALASKSPGWIAACGWAGACTSIAPLIELLAEAKDEAAFAVADALERITSAGLFEDRLLPEELIAVEDPPDPEPPAPRPQPLGRLVSDGRDKPDESAGGALPLPTIDAGRWRAWFGRENARFPVGHRARRGLPYSPLVVLGELDTARAMLGERRWMQAELVVRTGRHVRFDPHDWVARQEQALLQWGPLATSASSLPGRWSLPRRA